MKFYMNITRNWGRNNVGDLKRSTSSAPLVSPFVLLLKRVKNDHDLRSLQFCIFFFPHKQMMLSSMEKARAYLYNR